MTRERDFAIRGLNTFLRKTAFLNSPPICIWVIYSEGELLNGQVQDIF